MRKIIFCLYFVFLLTITIFTYQFIDPNLIYLKNIYTGFAFINHPIVTCVYLVLILAYFIFYLLFLNLFKKGIFLKRDFKLILGITFLVLFLSYPAVLSYDIFNYLATSKVLFLYQENPYIIMPIQFANDPMLLFTHAANKVALYGPFWVMITIIPFLLGMGNFLIMLFSFKLFIAAFYFLTVYVIYKMTKDLYSLALFAFNPLVIIETFVSSHNDIVMMFLVILSFYLIQRKKILFSIIIFSLSILIKYASLFLLPIFLYMFWLQFKNKKINWEKIFYFSSILMFTIFIFSPIREEIYPWYGIWFLVFLPFIKSKMFKYIFIAFSFGLLLRYIPFMYFASYLDPTPLIKSVLTFLPPLMVLVYSGLKKLCVKYLYH